jgi:hypothetical protein
VECPPEYVGCYTVVGNEGFCEVDVCSYPTFGVLCKPVAGDGAGQAPCQGGAPDLWQMSGNVAEWEDSCSGSTGAGDLCQVRGGWYGSNSTELQCDDSSTATRAYASAEVGFRCCMGD